MRLCIWNFQPVLSAKDLRPSGNVLGVASHSFNPPTAPLVYHHESRRTCLYGMASFWAYSCTASSVSWYLCNEEKTITKGPKRGTDQHYGVSIMSPRTHGTRVHGCASMQGGRINPEVTRFLPRKREGEKKEIKKRPNL